MAVGKPKIRTKIQFFQLILLGILIYPLTINWGILGASIAVTAYALIFNFVAVYKVLKIVRSDVRKALKIVVFPIMGTVLMMCASMFIKIYIFNKNTDILSFPLLIVSSLFLYLIVMYLFEIFFNYGNIQLMQNQFKSFAQK